MSAASDWMDQMEEALARTQIRAERLHRVLSSEVVSLAALPVARSMLTQGLNNAASCAEMLGDELGDIRWVAVVAILHNAASKVGACTAREARQIAELMPLMTHRVAQLRNARSSVVPEYRIN